MSEVLQLMLNRWGVEKLHDLNSRGSRFTELLRNHNGEEALKQFCEIIEIQPDWTQLHFEIMKYAVRDEFMADRLFPHLSDAIDKEPRDAQLRYMMGLLLQSVNDLEGAIEEFEEAIRLRSDYAVAYHNLAVAHNIENPQEAVELWKTATRLNPNLAEAHFALGAVLMRLGRDREGLESFRKFVPLAYPALDAYKEHALLEIAMHATKIKNQS